MEDFCGHKVITASQMRELEAKAVQHGQSDEQFMQNAGKAIAVVIEKLYKKKKIFLLIGKGNNGGDAFVAGSCLLDRGYAVEAYLIFPIEQCSALSQKNYQIFQKKQGKTVYIENASEMAFEKNAILIDGLLGTGFSGAIEGKLKNIIETMNQSSLPIIAIDIPSGLNGDSGSVETIAVHADYTIYLGFPKLGFFIQNGWDYIGHLIGVDFGLEKKFIEEVDALYNLIREDLSLPSIKRTRHKYEAGLVMGIGGSQSMKGAVQLSGLAALHSGAGIVKLFVPKAMQKEITFPMELIFDTWEDKSVEQVIELCNQAKALFIGPGLGRAQEIEDFFLSLLPHIHVPCVLDADALFFLSKNSKALLPKNVIITPHKKEMLRLLNLEEERDHVSLHKKCQKYVEEKHVILVLKGSPTVIFSPQEKPYILPHGDPGMATAGTGDVLTGIIASFLAQKYDPLRAAITASWLHAKTGELASKEKTPYCMVASDIINYLPKAIKKLLKKA